MAIVVIAEKPSVAQDLARVLGASRRKGAALEGNGYIVSWAIGHLVGLAEPDDLDPALKRWRRESLPILPDDWRLKVHPQTRDHFEAVRELLQAPAIEKVICATDAGREGELIFRYIYRMADCHKPVERLWISSLTPDAIRKGFQALRPARAFDPLAAAAEARSRADWLVGMNLTRAYSIRYGESGAGPLSVGRVQTPTLAMLVEREKAIAAFVPEDYVEVRATFAAGPAPAPERFTAVWFDPEKRENPTRLPSDGEAARAIVARCAGREGTLLALDEQKRREPPPLLYDLTELQRHANRLFGMTAKETLETAQALYERHKLLSYPRTDSRHLTKDVEAELKPILAAIAPRYPGLVSPATGQPLSRRFVDDAKVTDHHALLPTGLSPEGRSLKPREAQLYDLVCRRLLMAWHGDLVTSVAHVQMAIEADRFKATGTRILEKGWKILEIAAKADKEAEPPLPTSLTRGASYPCTHLEAQKKQTRPPKRFTDASLLTAMETAGKTLEQGELEEAMRERGLGTPATRAAILETLLARGLAERNKKALSATPKGIALIDVVHEAVKSPSMTGEWELALKKMEQGEGSLAGFTERIGTYVSGVVKEIFGETSPSRPSAAPPTPPRPPPAPSGTRNTPTNRNLASPTDLAQLLRRRFGFDHFRPHQEEVCRAVAEGADALLVMPTGSGKSLCYQLPGLARGGTTLVISPLIALMEDQTLKLQALGMRAERIHSGRSREESRDVCRRYLQGEIDFLTIAPERLSVPGFPEFLAKRPPTLITVDEAHCISQWGHDFRPDYRLIRERLTPFRASPILALTATATTRVQKDIVEQLGIGQALRFIRGFRRDNIAIEVSERPRSERLSDTIRTLTPDDRRPAVVYVPTRKIAEETAHELGKRWPCAAYHAGLAPPERNRAQEAFLSGELEVVVATIAFGMGIDKSNIRTVIHMALPGTLDGYYQEIGRAGRDSLPSRALLLYSYGDLKVHESFFARDYPETRLLAQLLSEVPPEGILRESLLRETNLTPETAEPALDKLWIHGALKIDADDRIFPAPQTAWRRSYEGIRDHREEQLKEVLEFAQATECRMKRLVHHFGERDEERCGHCDVCAPDDCVGKRYRPAKPLERVMAEELLRELKRQDAQAIGTLFRAVGGERQNDRKGFERIVDALIRVQAIQVTDDTFEKNGETIRFRRAQLGPHWRYSLDTLLLEESEATTPPKPRSRKPAAPPPPPAPGPSSSPRGSPAARALKSSAFPIPDSNRVENLREWRRSLARQRGIPAFRIMTDRVLYAVAEEGPDTLGALAQISGVGPKMIEQHGREILDLIREGRPSV